MKPDKVMINRFGTVVHPTAVGSDYVPDIILINDAGEMLGLNSSFLLVALEQGEWCSFWTSSTGIRPIREISDFLQEGH